MKTGGNEVVLDYGVAVRGVLIDDHGGPLQPPGLKMGEALGRILLDALLVPGAGLLGLYLLKDLASSSGASRVHLAVAARDERRSRG